MRTAPSRRKIKPLKAEAIRLQAEDDPTLWELKIRRHGRDSPKTYTYWMASWHEDGRMRNVYLGSTRKMDAEAAMQKARAMKAEALECSGGLPGGQVLPPKAISGISGAIKRDFQEYQTNKYQ